MHLFVLHQIKKKSAWFNRLNTHNVKSVIMNQSIHAHTVLNLLLAEDAEYTLASLKHAVEAEYGEGVRFYTCSQQDLTFDALLSFLLERQKVVLQGDMITANRERMCSH